jgi:hypothetical protein
MSDEKVYNVLFLCTGNTARSILGECSINRWGGGRFRGFRAGSHPKGYVHPLTLELLRRSDFDTSGLRSKDGAEFAEPGAARMDFVFTVIFVSLPVAGLDRLKLKREVERIGQVKLDENEGGAAP